MGLILIYLGLSVSLCVSSSAIELFAPFYLAMTSLGTCCTLGQSLALRIEVKFTQNCFYISNLNFVTASLNVKSIAK